METDLGLKEAIIAVLSAAKAPMHYTDIATELLFLRELRAEPTATPAATVAATIRRSFKHDGEHSPFIRVSKGVYGLRRTQTEAPAAKKEQARAGAEEVAEMSWKSNHEIEFNDMLMTDDEKEERRLGHYEIAPPWSRTQVVGVRSPF